MPGSNEFLPFGTDGAANVLTQAAYTALASRLPGFSAGVAQSAQMNKVWRQATFVASMIGEFIAQVGNVDALDNGDRALLLARFIAALDTRIASSAVADRASWRSVFLGPTSTPPISPTANDEVLVADSPTGAFAGQARKLARWDGSAWSFSSVALGRVFRVGESTTFWQLTSSGWSAFTVPIGFVAGLQTALDGKSNLGHTHAQADITGLVAALADKISRAGDLMSGGLRLSYNFPDLRLGEVGGAWRMMKNANVGASGNLLFQHSNDLFTTNSAALALSPQGAIGVGPTSDFGSADRLLAGGSVPQWRTLAEMGFMQPVAAVDARNGTVTSVGCTVTMTLNVEAGASGATFNSLEQLQQYLVTFTTATAALVGNAAGYRVFGYARQAIGPNTYIYNSNGETSGQANLVIPVAISDTLHVKNASSFAIRSASHLSLLVYKV